MFHHFHNETHPQGQGSLDTNNFNKMLDWLKSNYNLLSADDYLKKALSSSLEKDDICLSFDDALLCQYEVAFPVLEERNIKAFFFIYSSPLNNQVDYLEIFRFFRTISYETIDEFYADFFSVYKIENFNEFLKEKEKYNKLDYLSAFEFYSNDDKWFRYIRDQVLTSESYQAIMLKLLEKKDFDMEAATSQLWMTDEHISDLNSKGHILGLHSYNHPMTIQKLSYSEQQLEYKENYDHLKKVIGETKIITMSHPCGNYNQDTLKVLKDMGIKVGFLSSMAGTKINSLLELPREDQANVAREMNL
jgi:peptidoglycan/xylan/chitin deacetylase (PgdA/CDA1 family)